MFWQHFYDQNFSGTDFTTHYVVLGFASESLKKICYCRMNSMTITAG
ncbi:hypothetical protein ACLK1T_23890 [Escherichia coli]